MASPDPSALLAPVEPAPLAAPIHLVGIGGAGMSCIARILLARGVAVSGSDAKESRGLDVLRALGARIAIGHDPAHLDGVRTVVVSTAIREANVELVEARRRGLPVVRRAGALAALMAGRRGIAVAGTHGKTTTTSMLTIALQHCGADPSFAIGGDLNEPGSNAHHGGGEIFVAEADESDGSFLLLEPHAAIVTNVEPDHLDYYRDAAAVAAAFRDFAARIPAGGFLVVCADDSGARALGEWARDGGIDVRSYGRHPGADLRVEQLSSGPAAHYDAVLRGRSLGPVRLQVAGEHMALNSAAALLAGLGLGISAGCLREGLSVYAGVRRRFELKGSVRGVRVYDDYAHHPTEISAALRTARQVAGNGRLVVAFQPHRYTRTAAFATQLGHALGAADEVVVMEVYAAGEEPLPGANGATVAGAVPLPIERVTFEPSWSQVAPLLARRAVPGDLVLTLGAGDVTMIGGEVLAALADRTGGSS